MLSTVERTSCSANERTLSGTPSAPGRFADQNVRSDLFDVVLADFPLIQHLHGRLPGAMPRPMSEPESAGVGCSYVDAVVALRLTKRPLQRRHFHSRDRRFPPLVGRPVHRTIERLFHRVGREHAERHRHAGCRRGLGDAVRARRRDVLEVRASRRESDSPGRRPRRNGRASRPPLRRTEFRMRRAP